MTKLSQVVDELRNATSSVRTQGNAVVMIELVKNDHRWFMTKIATCLKGELAMVEKQLSDHHTCRFGKWYDKESQRMCGQLPSYKTVDEPHKEIHKLSREAIVGYQAGNGEKADQLYTAAEAMSKQIVASIDKKINDCMKASADT